MSPTDSNCSGATDDLGGQRLAQYSSRGPTGDGRIKPEVVRFLEEDGRLKLGSHYAIFDRWLLVRTFTSLAATTISTSPTLEHLLLHLLLAALWRYY